MKRYFPSSLDRFQMVMTTLALALGIGVPAGVAVTFVRLGLSPWLLAPTVLLVVVALGSAFAYRPLGVEVATSAITVKRPLGGKDIPFGEIQEITGAVEWPSKSIGVFRSGGFFGTYGVFWAPSWGRFEAWTTRKQPLVVVRLRDDRRVLLSVDDLAGFLAAVREATSRRPVPAIHDAPADAAAR
jgi:hypothetical protein